MMEKMPNLLSFLEVTKSVKNCLLLIMTLATKHVSRQMSKSAKNICGKTLMTSEPQEEFDVLRNIDGSHPGFVTCRSTKGYMSMRIKPVVSSFSSVTTIRGSIPNN